jgi:CheY-like chemotaxis protein
LHLCSAMAPKILVIEDREYVRQVMVAVLVDAGYVAVGLPSAITALERLAEIRPQMILLDMEMPGMNGREFLVRLRAIPRWAELPVLIVSGYGETSLPASERPGLAVLAKPFDNTTLIDFVGRMAGPATIPTSA